jgi:hypothetical protein
MTGLTRSEILKKVPKLRPGSFGHFMLKAQIKPLKEKMIRGNNALNLYPANSIDKLNTEIAKKQ